MRRGDHRVGARRRRDRLGHVAVARDPPVVPERARVGRPARYLDPAARAARYVGNGDVFHLYEPLAGRTGYPYTPGLPILLAPFVMIGDHFHLLGDVFFPHRYPGMFLVLGPVDAFLGTVPVVFAAGLAVQARSAGDSTFRRSSFSPRSGRQSATCHPEDAIVTGLLIGSCLAVERGKWRTVGALAGAAILFKQWAAWPALVCLVVPPKSERAQTGFYVYAIPALMMVPLPARSHSDLDEPLRDARHAAVRPTAALDVARVRSLVVGERDAPPGGVGGREPGDRATRAPSAVLRRSLGGDVHDHARPPPLRAPDLRLLPRARDRDGAGVVCPQRCSDRVARNHVVAVVCVLPGAHLSPVRCSLRSSYRAWRTCADRPFSRGGRQPRPNRAGPASWPILPFRFLRLRADIPNSDLFRELHRRASSHFARPPISRATRSPRRGGPLRSTGNTKGSMQHAT